MKKVKEPKEKNNKIKIKNFFMSLNPILIFSIITSIILLIAFYKNQESLKIYTFDGHNDIVSINSGLIVLSSTRNAFEANNISYVGEDIFVNKYQIGYYVKNGSKKNIIYEVEGVAEKEKLEDIINRIVGFNATEPANVENYFNKETKELIKDNLYFIISYTDSESEEKVEEIKLNVIEAE